MIELFLGDITNLEVECIVNAANPYLMRGGGVCGAIHRAAGMELDQYLDNTYTGCPTGEARISPGFQAKASFIIHTVAPIWKDGTQNEPVLLESCYIKTLELAKEHHIQSIAFPALGCGIYGYPIDQGTKIACETVKKILENNTREDNPCKVIFCCFSEETYNIYKKNMLEI